MAITYPDKDKNQVDTRKKWRDIDANEVKAEVNAHLSNTSNPHSVTKTQVGLPNVDNTSDVNKPISSATQTALNAKADASSLTSHTGNVSNPHAVTKSQVGLSNVDNIATAAVDTTGTAIAFAVPQIYGSEGAPETGNITINTTGLVKGMTQLLIHNNSSEPTYGAQIKIIGGAYEINTLNYILLMAVSTSRILATISQEV